MIIKGLCYVPWLSFAVSSEGEMVIGNQGMKKRHSLKPIERKKEDENKK
jgi:hypothetical protein